MISQNPKMCSDGPESRWISTISWKVPENGISYPCLNLICGPRATGLNVNGCRATALVDTGADHSVMSSRLARDIGALPGRISQSHSFSGPSKTTYYELSVILDGIPVVIDIEASTGDHEEFFSSFQFVVGRDILNMGRLLLAPQRTSEFELYPVQFQP